MDKNTMFMIGAGVLGFLGVRYLIRKRNENEQKSEFRGRRRSRLVGQRANMISIDGKYGVCNKTGATIDLTAPSTNANTIDAFRRECKEAGGTMITTNYLPYGAKVRSYSSACGCGA